MRKGTLGLFVERCQEAKRLRGVKRAEKKTAFLLRGVERRKGYAG